MTDKTWKAFERQIARDFKTQRTPLSGSGSRHTKSDTLHESYYIEAKYRKKMPLFNLWASTHPQAKKEGKTPIIALKQKGFKGYLLLVNKQTFLSLLVRRDYAIRGKKEVCDKGIG